MGTLIESGLQTIGKRFPLTRQDTGAFARVKAGPMAFLIESYRAKGLGHVSAVSGSGLFGLMRMETLVVNATERDAPLYSSDRIAAMGKQTLLLELYDTLLEPACDLTALAAVKVSVAYLPDHDLGTHWYDSMKLAPSLAKRTKGKDDAALSRATDRYLAAYLDLAAAAPATDPQKKREKAAAYVNGLLERGGPSTDAFTKAIGAERTRELFTKYVFGTAD